jgi:hypothetical protein
MLQKGLQCSLIHSHLSIDLFMKVFRSSEAHSDWSLCFSVLFRSFFSTTVEKNALLPSGNSAKKLFIKRQQENITQLSSPRMKQKNTPLLTNDDPELGANECCPAPFSLQERWGSLVWFRSRIEHLMFPQYCLRRVHPRKAQSIIGETRCHVSRTCTKKISVTGLYEIESNRRENRVSELGLEGKHITARAKTY